MIIQHEYGIFGGIEGELLLTFMRLCTKPMLVTLHTALPTPSATMKSVTTEIVRLATTVVVLTKRSKDIIEDVYRQAKGKVFVIPHGIHPTVFAPPEKFKEKLDLTHRTILTTFGLLSRNKGIEYALEALPAVIQKYPDVLYLILGETHPVIRRNEGEKYRLELVQRIGELGLEAHVKFYDQYFSLPDLLEFLKATDIYIATSINPNQAVSGTLSYALGTGLPVISTEFAQAKEIVTPETGRLVPIKDVPALSHALFDLLGDRKRLTHMRKNAYSMTRPMLWSSVAADYTQLLTRHILPPINFSHLKAMTDTFGLFQFATLTIPNKAFGYTLDDNARALVLCSWYSRQTRSKELENLLRVYLTFIDTCQQQDGSFINYISWSDKRPTHQNMTEDLEDTQMRAVWALAEIMANPTLPLDVVSQARRMFMKYLKRKTRLTHLRAKAFAIKAYTLALPILPEQRPDLIKRVTTSADALVKSLDRYSVKSWRWFEQNLNYNNALLSESLLLAGKAMKHTKYTRLGILSLDFLIRKTFSKTYMPIGHSSWYKNKETRSQYDQQPEDPASMILALSTAYTITGKKRYKDLITICFNWFLGANSLKLSLYDDTNGGCFDGLHPDRINLNQGAESLVSYLVARLKITEVYDT